MHEKFGEFHHVVFELCEHTDRQIHRHIYHNTLHPFWARSNDYNFSLI